MELQVTEAQYAERRRIRVEKIKALRAIKSFIQPAPVSIPHQLTNASSTRKSQAHTTENDCFLGNDKTKNRQIKNRESALLSRKRKLEEMSYLHTKVNALEEEVFRLKNRLRLYEGDAVDIPISIVPNVHDMDTMSFASSESEEQPTTVARGRPPSKNRQYSKSVSKLIGNTSSVATCLVSPSSSSGYYPMQNKQMLSHLEPAVFDF